MKKLLPLLAVSLLTSCASELYTPQNRMISPEAQGKLFKGSVELRYSAAKEDEMEFENDDAGRPFGSDRDVHKLSGLVNVGLLDRLDFVYMDYLSGSSVGIFGAKVQLIGKPQTEAKKGNFSLSLFGGYGTNSHSFDTDDNDIANWTTNIDKIDYEISHEDLGLILGYRWDNKFLHYVNAYYFHERIEGKVTTDSNALRDAEFKDTQDGMIYSTGVIYDLNESWLLKADYSHMTSKWSSKRGDSSNAVNAGIGANW